MRKIIAGVLVGVLLSTAAHAVIQRNPLSDTRFHKLCLNVVYERDDPDAIRDVFIKGNASILDDLGVVVGSCNEGANIDQLPVARRAEIISFAKWFGKQMNIACVDENVEPDLP